MASWQASTGLKRWFQANADAGPLLAMLLLMYASNVLASGAWLANLLFLASQCNAGGREHRLSYSSGLGHEGTGGAAVSCARRGTGGGSKPGGRHGHRVTPVPSRQLRHGAQPRPPAGRVAV
jgi:hypothetical protein